MIEELKKYGDLEEHASTKLLNTYKIGGSTRYLIEPNSIQDLVSILRILKENNIKWFILGNGSNIILNSREYDGAFIKLNKLNGLEVNGNNIYAEAGVMVPNLVKVATDNSLMGLEFAAGIPGTVGGSVYGNAGAYNSCIMDYVQSVTVIDEDLNIKVIEHEDINYSYRMTDFKNNKKQIIVAVKFTLTEGEKERSIALINDRRKRRLESQPLEYPSAGSVFRNPEGDFAGRLVEICDLKGYKIGGAKVSEKHANFIVNAGNATSEDVYNLIHYVHDTVKEKTHVDLLCEQEFIDWE